MLRGFLLLFFNTNEEGLDWNEGEASIGIQQHRQNYTWNSTALLEL